jgi:hypothetical protein
MMDKRIKNIKLRNEDLKTEIEYHQEQVRRLNRELHRHNELIKDFELELDRNKKIIILMKIKI